MEIFFFTENAMTECLYYKVNYRNQELFELIMWLVYLEIRGDALIPRYLHQVYLRLLKIDYR